MTNYEKIRAMSVQEIADLNNGKGFFHHYPLKVYQNNEGTYMYRDRFGVCMCVPDESEKFNTVQFDIVESEVER